MKRFQYILLLCLPGLLWLTGCRKEHYAEMDKGDSPLAISASSAAFALKEADRDKEIFHLNWTTGSNEGTNAAITYTLQIAKQGSNFADPVTEQLGAMVFVRHFTAGALNDMLSNHFNAASGTEITLEARIIAQTQADGVAAQTASPVTFKVTPYVPVSSTLYLIGDASPGGWDNNNATPLEPIAAEPGGFTWTGMLNAGELKFLTTLGQWIPTYNKSANSSDSLFYRTDFGEPDDKFLIATMGTYTIRVNLLNLTVSIVQPTHPVTPPYSRLWIVGDATPNGWNIDNPNEMRVDKDNLFVFTYNEVLAAGDFKIPTATGNWGCDYYMPPAGYPPLSATDVQLIPGGSPDNKWKITTPGAYKIKLDLYNMKIDIKPFNPYTQLWLVGDATPVGWNINSPEPMVADPVNPYLFTWQGAMTAGEFKIPTSTGNWGGDYFMPMVQHQDLGSTAAKFVAGGNPDNKWKITDPGTYRITLDQLRETIMIQKL